MPKALAVISLTLIFLVMIFLALMIFFEGRYGIRF